MRASPTGARKLRSKTPPSVVSAALKTVKTAGRKVVPKKQPIPAAPPAEVIVTVGELVGKDVRNKLFVLANPADESTSFPNRDYGYLRGLPRMPMVIFSATRVTYPNGAIQVKAALETGGDIDQFTDPSLKLKEVQADAARLKKIGAAMQVKQFVAALHPRYHDFVGADPEIFAFSKDGELIPAFEFLRSKREDPATYWDGYQAEFTIEAGTCLDRMTGYFRDRLTRLDSALKARFKGARLGLLNTVEVPAERLATDRDEVVAFGCSPSKNIYEKVIFPDVDPRKVPFRSAGGHMHFSYKELNGVKIPDVIRELDRILGVISVSMFRYYDTPQRRGLYGRAGEYRTPSYGFEYRVLSNAWLCHPGIVYSMYEMARHIMGYVRQNGKPWKDWDITEEEARTCINNVDVEMAEKLLIRNDEQLTYFLAAVNPIARHIGAGGLRPESMKIVQNWKDVILNGVHKYLSDPDHLSEAWGIEGRLRGAQSGSTSAYRPWQMFQTSQYLATYGRLDGAK